MNKTKRGFQLAAAITAIVTGAIMILACIIILADFNTLYNLTMQFSGYDYNLYSKVKNAITAMLVIFIITSTVLVVFGSLFCFKKFYYSKGIAITLLVISCFASTLALAFCIVFLCIKDNPIITGYDEQTGEPIYENFMQQSMQAYKTEPAQQNVPEYTVNKYREPQRIPVARPNLREEEIADLLVKYKKLLDDGIITQEEFFAKKQQLLR